MQQQRTAFTAKNAEKRIALATKNLESFVIITVYTNTNAWIAVKNCRLITTMSGAKNVMKRTKCVRRNVMNGGKKQNKKRPPRAATPERSNREILYSYFNGRIKESQDV